MTHTRSRVLAASALVAVAAAGGCGTRAEAPVDSVSAVAEEVAAVPSERAVAVLLPDPGGDEESRGDDDELGGGGYPAVHEAAELARPGTSVLPLALAKGLEFDVVVVVDPERVLARSPQGMQDLYVVATRATQELILVQPGGFGPLLSGIRDRLDDSAQELTA